ncbi:hypothetical protein FPQ18DRAFT_356920 [Pyronema domesticum]|nr:hypothetical protein FPQ18DRAFT_356920 [Pyronema domesticum]
MFHSLRVWLFSVARSAYQALPVTTLQMCPSGWTPRHAHDVNLHLIRLGCRYSVMAGQTSLGFSVSSVRCRRFGS